MKIVVVVKYLFCFVEQGLCILESNFKSTFQLYLQYFSSDFNYGAFIKFTIFYYNSSGGTLISPPPPFQSFFYKLFFRCWSFSFFFLYMLLFCYALPIAILDVSFLDLGPKISCNSFVRLGNLLGVFTFNIWPWPLLLCGYFIFIQPITS